MQEDNRRGRGRPPKLNVEQKALALKLSKEDGLSMEEIGRRLNVCSETVRTAVLECGEKPLGRTKESRAKRDREYVQFFATKEELDTLLAEYAETKSVRPLAAKYKTSHQTICNAIRRAGGTLLKGRGRLGELGQIFDEGSVVPYRD